VKAIPAGKGKIEEGIDVLREYEIFNHPSCENSVREIIGWSYQTDQNGEVIPVPEKKRPFARRPSVCRC